MACYSKWFSAAIPPPSLKYPVHSFNQCYSHAQTSVHPPSCNFVQGFFHEIGHNHQFSFSPSYMGETTVNVWSLLLSEQIMKVNRTARFVNRPQETANYFATGSECCFENGIVVGTLHSSLACLLASA